MACVAQHLAASEPVRRTPSRRILPLDGMRGLAAVIVFAHHALALLYGPLAGINAQGRPAQPHWLSLALHWLPLGWMFNGAFAVSFFFVLSGFVLTRAVGNDPEPARMARLMGARLFRLVPLVVIGTLVGFALFTTYVHHLDMLRVWVGNDSRDFIAAPLLQHHDFMQAIKQMLVAIWHGAPADTLFDPPLWSIGVELQGSILIYMIAAIFAGTKRRSAKYLIGAPIGLVLMGTSALCFLAGMAIAERFRDTGEVLPLSAPVLKLAAVAVLVWASVHPWARELWLPLPFNPPEVLDTLIGAAGAAVLIACGLQLAGLKRVLVSRPVRILGDASYGLYVAHVPILYTGCAPLMLAGIAVCGYHAAAVLTSGILLVLSVGIGWLLVHYVDTPMAQWSKRRVTGWLA